ncbi:hypothetical protein VFDL14_18785 [Vibrio fortis]|uniref:Phage-shock protein n=1 Tax=Vibrio fortis TaxID=212667 RepID=A0A066UKE4_9VIBR|nr:hypothetical protein [Vibrio fortis]KDN27535.1 hypothetical protein VFDL14_18785 [Vibrio fortis]
MQVIINGRKIENPLAIALVMLFVLSAIGGVVALFLFVFLPLIGVFVSGAIGLILVVVVPIVIWFIVPVLFLSMISWVFGKILK